jgi:hypothetical protein
MIELIVFGRLSNKWHTHTWKIDDALFTGKLGWHFLLDAAGAGNDVLIREVKVSR